MTPLFSCVIPVKGSRPYMDETLASLRSQGMGDDLEVIVQDADIEPDRGQSDALNKGFAKATGRWLFWLNADDILLPGALDKVRRCIQQDPSASWIAGGTRYIDPSGRKISEKTERVWHGFLYRHMPVWTYGPSAFFRRDLWQRTGGLDTELTFVMDLDLWKRFQLAGFRYAMLPGCIWGFRVHEGSKTAGPNFVRERREEWERFMARYGLRHHALWLNALRLTRLMRGLT